MIKRKAMFMDYNSDKGKLNSFRKSLIINLRAI